MNPLTTKYSMLALLASSLASGLALAEEKNPERNAYFGETHLHTSWSVDAWVSR